MNISIRLAVPTNAADMAEIHARSWEVAYNDIIPPEVIKDRIAKRSEMWQNLIADDNTIHYIIHADGKAAGIMSAGPSRDDDADESVFEVYGIYLHPHYFRQGIGTKAMAFAIDKAIELCKSAITVWVLAENTNSIRFYEKCGFAADGKIELNDYGRSLETIRMRREI